MGGTSKKHCDGWGHYDGDTLIREQVRCWILKMISHAGETNFKSIFIVFMNHKMICRRAEELHILNDIVILGT